MTWLLALVSFAAGMAAQWALSRHRVRKGKSATGQFFVKIRGPVYVEPSQFSHDWERRA